MLNYFDVTKAFAILLSVIPILCISSRVIYCDAVERFYVKGDPDSFVYKLIKYTIVSHEQAHAVPIRTFNYLYGFTTLIRVPEKISKPWYARLIKISYEIDEEDIGKTTFKGGCITKFFASIMPLGLLMLTFIAILFCFNTYLVIRLIAGASLFVLIPSTLGSMLSKKDFKLFVQNSYLLIVPAIVYIGYLCFNPLKIKALIMFLLGCYLALVILHLFLFILLFFSLIHWINDNSAKINLSWNKIKKWIISRLC